MCGIVGAVSQRNISEILLDGLQRLEYRGYDSAGIAWLDEAHNTQRIRRAGKVSALVEAVQQEEAEGKLGIAHTRWATHGEPSETNAHPHQVQDIAIVHNGIIENFEALKKGFVDQGASFESETDSEVIAHCLAELVAKGESLTSALMLLSKQLQGAYAIAVISANEPESLVVTRRGSPLVIGLGIGENFIASDALALQAVSNRFIYLEEGDVATVSRNAINILNDENKTVERELVEYSLGENTSTKGRFKHYMAKEIYEQPKAIEATLENRLGEKTIVNNILGLDSAPLFKQVENIQIIACGTSYHAGLVAKYWFESIAKVACQVEVASEYRYRKKVIPKNGLILTISQSGETADTLAALREVQDQFLSSVTVCNVPSSSLVRESTHALMTYAGPEIGVASTKAFTTQLVALLLLVTSIAKQKGLDKDEEASLVADLKSLPKTIEHVLNLDTKIETMAQAFAEKHHALFLGRGVQFPIALEGALKLKEISYIHAEAYPAGELKHGPLALVDKDMPVVAVAPNDDLYEKLTSNLNTVASRGGELFVFIDEDLAHKTEKLYSHLSMPKVSEILAPIVYTVPLQLLSYHVAVIKGTDVDQPRNLAKSVTVE